MDVTTEQADNLIAYLDGSDSSLKTACETIEGLKGLTENQIDEVTRVVVEEYNLSHCTVCDKWAMADTIYPDEEGCDLCAQ